jgi:hypothetical protein
MLVALIAVIQTLLASGVPGPVPQATSAAPTARQSPSSGDLQRGLSPDPGEWVYTVRPGDTLWALTREYLADVRYGLEVQRRNGLADPHRLRAGTRLRVPFEWLKQRPAPARVLAVHGGVTVERALTRARAALVAGSVLNIGDVVVTDAGGSVTIGFADDSRLVLSSGGRLVLDLLTVYGANGMVDTRLRLDRGRTWSAVAPGGGRRGRFRLTTPAAAAVARGTELRVSADDQRPVTRTEVLEGLVDVAGSGRTEPVPAGFGIEVEAGKPPAAPVVLLPAPVLPGEMTVRRLPIRIELPKVDGAAAYRAEIAADTSFSAYLHDSVATAPAVRGVDLPDGRYALRVRAVDARGIEGRDAVASLVIDARPEPPVLIEPAPQSFVADPQPRLQWTASAGAAGYRVQVAGNERFEPPLLIDRPTTDPAFTPESPLAAGRYFWRVATVAPGGHAGPFGDGQPFVRRDPQAGPSDATTAGDATQLVLRWSASTAPGARYHYQVAGDQAFAELVSEATVDRTEVSLPRPAPGTYYLRIKTIEADGFEGAYGAVQRLDVTAPPRPKRRWWPWLIVPLGGLLVVLSS